MIRAVKTDDPQTIMMKIYSPTIRVKQPLCCLVNPIYVCRMCRSHLCKECADISDGAIRASRIADESVQMAMRMADHLDLKCCQESLNSELATTWEG